MGTDVHIVLGKINMARLTMAEPAQSGSTELALFGGAKLDQEAFTIAEVPEELDVDRDYDLFSFLGNIRGDVKPYYMGDDRSNRTYEFLQWLSRKKLVGTTGRYTDRVHTVFDLDVGDYGFIIHLIQDLLSFDYDQIAEIEDGRDDDFKPIYVRPVDGQTYRQLFTPSYFRFLQYCKDEGWHFAIFGFDS